jgi:hypothetical protein
MTLARAPDGSLLAPARAFILAVASPVEIGILRSEIKKTGPRIILYQAYDMRVLGRYADMSACRKMPCVLILPAKWKKQQISTHASRISAKLGHPIVTSCDLLGHYRKFSCFREM